MVIRMGGCESRPQSYKIQSCLNVRSSEVKLETSFFFPKGRANATLDDSPGSRLTMDSQVPSFLGMTSLRCVSLATALVMRSVQVLFAAPGHQP